MFGLIDNQAQHGQIFVTMVANVLIVAILRIAKRTDHSLAPYQRFDFGAR